MSDIECWLNRMAVVGTDEYDGSPEVGHYMLTKPVELVWGSAVVWHGLTFIRWCGWTGCIIRLHQVHEMLTIVTDVCGVCLSCSLNWQWRMQCTPHVVYAVSFGAAFTKCLWSLVGDRTGFSLSLWFVDLNKEFQQCLKSCLFTEAFLLLTFLRFCDYIIS